MTTRNTPPAGAPCWADLWTSDVAASRAFYGALFGWDAEDPQPEFGGYFSFLRDGERIAGCMGDMGDMKATDTWKIYLCTDDAVKTVEVARNAGADIIAPAMPVADLGVQVVMIDPTGADLGAWQPGTHPGFTVLGEHGAPVWFELHTRDHARAVDFYRTVFGWDTEEIPGEKQIAYTVARDSSGGEQIAGIMDASSFLPVGTPSEWSVYWEVDDVDSSVEQVSALGGSVLMEPEDSPYGRIATVTDPMGASFKLCTSVSS